MTKVPEEVEMKEELGDHDDEMDEDESSSSSEEEEQEKEETKTEPPKAFLPGIEIFYFGTRMSLFRFKLFLPWLFLWD